MSTPTKVYEVTLITLKIEKSNPPQLKIIAEGTTRTSGYTNPQLSKVEYVVFPSDGIQEFDFIAEPPSGLATEQITPIEALFVWEGFPTELKGVRIYAENNKKEQPL